MKHIGHLIMVSLKYFFDIDHSICHSAFITVLIVMSVARLFFSRLLSLFHDGLLVVKEDLAGLRQQLNFYKERSDKRHSF